MSTKKHDEEAETESKTKKAAAEEGPDLNPGAPESPKGEAHPTSPSKSGPKPVPSPGKQVFDVESHKITELFESGDVVFTREGGAGELRAQPAHEAKTRFVEIDGKPESEFKDAQTTTYFKLKDGRNVAQTGHKTIITDKNGRPSTAGPALNIHAGDFQG